MKTITPYLLKFALAAIILTILFRYFLSYGIEHRVSTIIAIAAITYAVSMFVSGFYYGKKDGEYLPIFDIGFRFHLATYVIHNGITLLWIGLNFGSKYENFNLPIMIAIYWGVILFIHFIFYLYARKNSINYLDKQDIFE